MLNAYTYGRLSALAYNHENEPNHLWSERVTAELAADGWEARCFHTGDCEAIVAHRDDRVIVAFRGTEPGNLNDMMTDLRGLRKHRLRCSVKVHYGAYRSLMQVWPDLLPYIRKVSEGRTVDLTGHSLGGMLASIATLLLIDEPIRIGNLATFGAPPAGNGEAASAICYALSGRTIRYVHCSDWVPRIRIQWMLGYRHFNGLRYIDRTGVVLQSPRGWYRLLDRMMAQTSQMWGWLRGRNERPLRSLRDHDLQNQYLELM